MTEKAAASPPAPPRPCPVCSAALNRSSRAGVSIDICEEHGVWLHRGELQEILQREREKVQPGPQALPAELWEPSAPRSCPVCSASLVRKSRSGVLTDVCAKHGIWLDRGELEEILRREGRRSDSRLAAIVESLWDLWNDLY